MINVTDEMLNTAIDAAMRALELAQSNSTAWLHVFQSIEAHLLDRIAMKDAADPQTYLDIIRHEVADVERVGRHIAESRWADSGRYQEQIARLESQITELNGPDSAAFVAAIENPPEPNAALKTAAKRYKASIADHDRATDGRPMSREDIQTALDAAPADPPIHAVLGALARSSLRRHWATPISLDDTALLAMAAEWRG